MKLYKLLILLFVAVAFADDDGVKVEEDTSSKPDPSKSEEENRKDFLTRIGKECKEETGVSEEESKRLMMNGEELAEATQEGKCFLKCIFKKEGFFDENDEPKPEYVVEALRDPQNRELMYICMRKEGTDACDRAYNILRCYIKSSQEMFRRLREQAKNDPEYQESSHTMPRVNINDKPKEGETKAEEKQESKPNDEL